MEGGILDIFGIAESNLKFDDLDGKKVPVSDLGEEEEQKEVDEEETKEEEEEVKDEEVPNEDEAFIASLIDEGLLNYDPNKEYDMSKEGIKELIKDTVERERELIRESVTGTLTSNPEAKRLLDVLATGGSVEDYLALDKPFDFNTVDLYTEDGSAIEANMVNLIEDWLISQGMSKDDIDDEINSYISAGLLEKKAVSAQKSLVKLQEKTNAESEREIEIRKQEFARQKDLEAAEFKNSIHARETIAGFNVTKEETKKLHEFITKADSKGQTGFMKKDNEESRLLYAYLTMKGFDKTALEQSVKSEVTRNFKKKITQFSDTNSNNKRSSGATTAKENVSIADIPWII